MNINSFLPEDLKAVLTKEGFPSFRADQIFKWLHQRQIGDFSLMTDIPKPERERLAGLFKIIRPKIVKVQTGKDGTKKYLLEFEDNKRVEAVLLTDRGGRKTACVSSQVGCGLGCRICATAKMGLMRNLSAAEITAQVELVYKENNGFENLVFMGMGEPLLNLENVLKSIKIINHPQGLNIGARKITISTAGLPGKIKQLADFDKQIRLAVSLNAAFDHKRSQIMPINNKYPLAKVMNAIKTYIHKTGRRVTIEYVLIKDFNDLKEDVLALWQLVKDLKVNINLVPLNRSSSKYRPSSPKVQEWFLAQLANNGINAVLRKSKGEQIKAGCGQLYRGWHD